MVLFAIEGERADSLKTQGVNGLIVIVLESEVLPDNDAGATFYQKRYSTASEVAAFRADVERGSTVGQVRRTLCEESSNACFLLVRITPAERRNEIDVEPRRQRHSIDHEVEKTPLGAASATGSSGPSYVQC